MTSKPLVTDIAQNIFYNINLGVTFALIEMNNSNFLQSQSIIQKIVKKNDKIINNCILNNEDYANDLFVIRRYIDFFGQYIDLWSEIYAKNFSNTWNTLQNCLDLLRLVKRFSSINMSFFERQLTNLEKAYPYRVFSSVGMTYTIARCVICNQDIDGFECEHIKGNLYWGHIARAQLTGAVEMDHLALTKNPKDKRCVIRPQEGFEDEFKVLQYIISVTKKPSEFHSIEIDDNTSHARVILSDTIFKIKELV